MDYNQLMPIVIVVGFVVVYFVLLNMFSRKFLSNYFKVKTSQGKLKLVHLRMVNDGTFTTGRIEDGFLLFKDYKRTLIQLGDKERRIAVDISKNCFERLLGVDCIHIDDQKNSIFYYDEEQIKSVTGFDPIRYEKLLTRALSLPEIKNEAEAEKFQKMSLLLLIIVLLGVGVAIYFLYNNEKRITAVISLLKALPTVK